MLIATVNHKLSFSRYGPYQKQNEWTNIHKGKKTDYCYMNSPSLWDTYTLSLCVMRIISSSNYASWWFLALGFSDMDETPSQKLISILSSCSEDNLMQMTRDWLSGANLHTYTPMLETTQKTCVNVDGKRVCSHQGCYTVAHSEVRSGESGEILLSQRKKKLPGLSSSWLT